MAYLVTIMTVIRHRVIGGMDAAIWVIVGMLAFFAFRRSANQAVNGISANRSLFTYRQVRPVDTIMVRAMLEGMLMILVSLIVLFGVALFDKPVFPDDPLFVLGSVAGLWLFGLSLGMVFSVPNELIPEFNHIYSFLMMPLYLISGVILPVSNVPYPYQEWLMYNPIVHGVEGVRSGYSTYYHAPQQLNIDYLFMWDGIFLLIGLALQLRFVQRLIAR